MATYYIVRIRTNGYDERYLQWDNVSYDMTYCLNHASMEENATNAQAHIKLWGDSPHGKHDMQWSNVGVVAIEIEIKGAA